MNACRPTIPDNELPECASGRVRKFRLCASSVDAQLGFEQSVLIELQISRRVVGRIATDDYQQFNAAGINIVNQIVQRLSLIDGIRFEWIGVRNCLADIAERAVHRMGQRMNRRRRFIAGDHDAGAPVLLEIASDWLNPFTSVTGSRRTLAGDEPLADGL